MSDILNEAMKRAGWGAVKLKKNSKKSKLKSEKDNDTLTERKTKEEIRRLQIGNEKDINTLVLRSLARSILEDIGHGIQTAFVDLPRREAPSLAAMAGAPGLEREFEKHLAGKIQDAIMSVLSNIDQKTRDGTYE